MSKHREPLRLYHNQQLMDDYNEMQIRIKAFLFDLPDKVKLRHPKPTVQELDQLMNRVMEALRVDNELMRKR